MPGQKGRRRTLTIRHSSISEVPGTPGSLARQAGPEAGWDRDGSGLHPLPLTVGRGGRQCLCLSLSLFKVNTAKNRWPWAETPVLSAVTLTVARGSRGMIATVVSPGRPARALGAGPWARRRGFTRGGASASDSAPDRSHPRRSLSGGGWAGVLPAMGP